MDRVHRTSIYSLIIIDIQRVPEKILYLKHLQFIHKIKNA